MNIRDLALWSNACKKSNQRWLWHAVCHETNTVLAYVLGKRKDVVFKELKEHLASFGIAHFTLMTGALMNDISIQVNMK